MRKLVSVLLVLALFGISVSPAGVMKVKAAAVQKETEMEGPVSEVKSTEFDTSNIQYSGKIGDIMWGIDASGVFAFYHSDATPGKAIKKVSGFPTYNSYREVPWYQYRELIKCVTLANPDSYIVVGSMDYLFYEATNLEYIVRLPAVATSMKYTFGHCGKLTTVGCIMPSVSNLNFCFTSCNSLCGDVLFATSPTSCRKAFTGTECDVLVVPEIYDTNSQLATQSECSRYAKLGSCQLTLYGISRVDGSLLHTYASDSYVSSIQYGQKVSDAEVGSTGGLRLAYTHVGSSFLRSVYVPCSLTGVKSSSVEWNTVLDVGVHSGVLDIAMFPAEQGILGTVQPAVFYNRSLQSLTVERCPIDECAVSLSSNSYTYDGSAKIPTVRLTNPYNGASLTKDTDFTVSYSNNVNAGTATVTIRGKGRYSGSASTTFTIARADMAQQVSATGYSGTYDGAQHGISVTAPSDAVVKYGTTSGTYDRDTSPTYASAGTYTVYYEVKRANYSTVTGSKTVVINPAEMTVSASGFRGTYDGASHGISVSISKPAAGAVVKYGTVNGTYNLNTSPVYKNVGNYTVYYQVTAPNYTTYNGSMTVQITAKDIASCTIVDIGTKTYNGTAQTPAPVVHDGSVILTKDADYTVEYANNINAGTATVTVLGRGNYSGRCSTTFTIAKTNMSVSASGYSGTFDQVAHGISVNVSVPASGAVIRYGTSSGACNMDSSPTFKSAGTHTVYYQVTASNYNTYTGSATVVIASKSIADCTVQNIGSRIYNGKSHTPSVSVSDRGTALVQDVDYTLTYSSNVKVGTAVVTIKGKGNYSGSVNQSFTITNATMVVRESGYSGIYDKAAHGISVNVENPSDGATIRYGTSSGTYNQSTSPTFENVGTYTVYYQVTAPNYHTHTGSATVRITAKDVKDCSISEITDVTYDGQAHRPMPVVMDGSRPLNLNTDYLISFGNNMNAGAAQVTISGKGNYTGSRSKTFVIQPLQLQTVSDQADGFVSAESVVYTGTAQNPKLSVMLGGSIVSLKEGEDYVVKANKGVEAGLGIASISGKGNYAGEITFSYTITAAPMDGYADAVKLQNEEMTYTGKEVHPDLNIHDLNGNLLEEGKDYDLVYMDAVDVGTAKVEAVFRGNYTGKIVRSFYIRPAMVEEVDLTETEFVYNGEEHKPEAKGFIPDKDYQVSYRDHVMAGKALAIFSFCGNYTGTVTKEFDICQRVVTDEIVFPTASEISYKPGQTVSASVLSNLENKYGSFCWDDPKQEAVVENEGYPVRFVPNDVKNYSWDGVDGWDAEEKVVIRRIHLPVKKVQGVLPDFRISCLAADDPIGVSEVSWDGESGRFCWPDEQLRVSMNIQNYCLLFIPADYTNYDWTHIGKWDEENKWCEIACSPVVIQNPEASCVSQGDRLAVSTLSSNQYGASYEWENPDLVVENNGDEVQSYRAVYHYGGETLVRTVSVPIRTAPPVEIEKPTETEKPVQTEEPAGTSEPVMTKHPVVTKEPVQTEEPAGTSEPVMTKHPVVTKEPVQTEKPIETEEPAITKHPVVTKEPVQTEEPVMTKRPVATEKPVQTEKPEETEKPIQIEEPAGTEKPVDGQQLHQEENILESADMKQPSAYEMIDQYIMGRTQINDILTDKIGKVKTDSGNASSSRKAGVREKWLKKRKTIVHLKKGEKLRLRIKGDTQKKRRKWHSSRRKVVSINQKGILTVRKKGTAKITIRVGKKKYTCVLKVKR